MPAEAGERARPEGQFVRTSMIAGNALAYSDDFCLSDGKVSAIERVCRR